jgi:WD40 repeat protein
MVLLSDRRICSVSNDGSLKIWNIETGVSDLTVEISNSALHRVIQLHDGRLVVSTTISDVYIIGG